jgi:transglutaminase-like putative cysteine protease
MKSFLQPELNIESDHKEIRDKAVEIARNSKNPILVAKRLKSWVYTKVRKQPVLSVPGAMEVLKKRIGDCNEHSVLLTAFLRASGIPAKICVGLVYARGGFYYHAWTEAYLGEWVSIDATLNQMPVDATHIKLVEGGLRRQVEIIGLIGKIGLKVIDYGYD